MTSYALTTAMWACDIVDSTDIDNDKKLILIEKIDVGIEKIIVKTNAQLITKEFRGDGYLIIFKAENAKTALSLFAESFCHYFIQEIEDNNIERNVKLRTYMDIGEVVINEQKNAIGNEVDNFCKLVDNKFYDHFEFREKCNLVLITSEKLLETINRSSEFVKTVIGGKEYYKLEQGVRNINVKINMINGNYDDRRTINEIIQESSKNYGIKIFETNRDCIFTISGNSTPENIYGFMIKIFDKVYSQYNKSKNKYLIISIDVAINEESIHEIDLIDYFNTTIYKGNRFRSYLVWSDICLDRFRDLEQYKKRQRKYRKLPLTAQMRAYFEDYSESLQKNMKIITYSEIKNAIIYLHSFDYCAQKLISSVTITIDISKHLSQQLEIALLLSDNIIIHAAEILRNDIVYAVLNKYRNFIKDGAINLLFSSKVNNIERDFHNYIQEKIQEYSKSEYGNEEVDSLKNALNESNLKKALELITLCPYMLKRDSDGTNTLEQLINQDLYDTSEPPLLSTNALSEPSLLRRNYSIKQILSARYFDNSGIHDILTGDTQYEIIDIIDQLVNGVISASIIKCVFEHKVPDTTKEKYKKWYQLLVNRINFLYAKVNTGNNLYMEYLPVRQRGGLFDIATFYTMFGEYTSVDGLLGPDVIFDMRSKKDKWDNFKLYYMAYKTLENEMVECGFTRYNANDEIQAKLKKAIKYLMS